MEIEMAEHRFKHIEIDISELKNHPQNYRMHPEPQIDHIAESIKANGFYRNIVVADDNTILAGHGVVQASLKLQIKTVPVIKLPISSTSPMALKILTGDNEIAHLAEDDKTLLANLLKSIKEDGTLLGTGHDDFTLSNLLFLTQPHSPLNAEEEWKGMPDYENQNKMSWRHIVMHFDKPEDIEAFGQAIGQPITDSTKYLWFPQKERQDTESKRY